MKVFIETERLILREIVLADAKDMFALNADPFVHTYLGRNPVKTIEQVEGVIDFIRQQYIDNGIGRWAIEEKETGKFVGWAGLKFIIDSINGHTNYFDLGYRLIRKYWGKGYASEAAASCVNYGFTNLMVSEIYAIADVDNIASVKVLERTGFRRMQTFDFENEQHYWFKLQKDEWILSA